ncbi:MAG: hypothetical protein ACAH89_04330 [Rariglobus sp.]
MPSLRLSFFVPRSVHRFSGLAMFVACVLSATAAEWQWSVPISPSAETANEKSRAFLWIPSNCTTVRGVVFGHHNMEEEGVLEHPAFRKAMAELGFAAVWVAPTFDRNFRYDQGAGERFDALMKALADQSGYAELATAPLVPVGHSAAASMPWYIAAWKPERVIAGISFSGQWPYVPDPQFAPQVAGVSIDAVPGIVTLGEYEWADERMGAGLKTKAEHPALPLSAVGCPADGHFYATDEKIEFLALYLKKAAQYRLPKTAPASGPVKLNAIDITKTGWLVDRYRKDKPPSAPAAPVGQYKGDAAQAFWFFDQELALAAEKFQQQHRGKPALLGYRQDGEIIPQKNGTHQQVTLSFKPEADGVTFKITGAFLDTVPEGRPEKWVGKKAGETLTPPPATIAPIELKRITGPIRQVSADTWELAFNRTSFLNDRRGNEAWLAAVWPGDTSWKQAVQQSQLRIPGRNDKGAPQRITFDLPATVRYGTRELKLSAKSGSGLPVRYFVREGPAEIDGDTVKFSQLPPRTKFPITVTLVAWQFGRSTEPKVQTAEPVERTLTLVR